jgi:hypothetical protein
MSSLLQAGSLLASGGQLRTVRPSYDRYGLPPLDKSRYLAFLEAGDGQSTPASWFDQSGNGNHFTQPEADRQATLVTDTAGYMRYDLSMPGKGHGYWQLPALSPAQADYTIRMVLNVADNSNENYLLDATNHTLLLSPGPGVGLYYSSLFGARGNTVLPLGKHLLTWNLSQASGGKVYVDGQLLYAGSYTQVPVTGGRLGQDYKDEYALVSSDYYALSVVLGSDSASQMQADDAYFRARWGLSF